MILFVATFYPFALMFMSSFKYQLQMLNEPWFFSLPLHVDNYFNAISEIYMSLLNSIIITSIAVVTVLITASMASFSFARYEYPGKNLIYILVIMLLMIPGFVLLVPQFILVRDLGLFNTYWGLVFPQAAGNVALAVLLMRTFFEGLPGSLYEAAEVEGANGWIIFTNIVLPLSKPILATVSIVSGLQIWNGFIWPLVITSGEKVRPIILAIIYLQPSLNQGDGLILAGYVFASIPMVVLFFFATKPFISGLTSGAIKG